MPVRFEVMKRKLVFLQYILKEDKSSMISQVLKATWDNKVHCDKYLETLEMNCSYEEIDKVSKYSFKKILKEKSKGAAFKYLMAQKLKQKK